VTLTSTDLDFISYCLAVARDTFRADARASQHSVSISQFKHQAEQAETLRLYIELREEGETANG
jgi:hypothetical protein